jgi:hypothetical protein
MAPVDLGTANDLADMFRLNALSPKGDFEHVLVSNLSQLALALTCPQVTLSTLPSLQTLRLLSLPDIEYGYSRVPNPANFITLCDDGALTTWITMQKLATQVLRTMATCGSPIKVFSSKPSIIPRRMRLHLPSSDGHHWPKFNYVRGKVTDLMAKEVVIAVPLRNMDLKMPSDPVLHQTVEPEYEYNLS